MCSYERLYLVHSIKLERSTPAQHCYNVPSFDFFPNNMENFTPLSAFIGGAFIGLSAALLLLLKGRIAGITGIMDSMVPPYERTSFWRGAFIIGLILGVLLYTLLFGPPTITVEASDGMLIIAGLLVGFGANLGSGCTSGHGICGIALFSKRSIIATLTFMTSAFATVFIAHHLLGLSS